jgi:hypothetical protein
MEALTGGQRLHDDVVLICLRLYSSGVERRSSANRTRDEQRNVIPPALIVGRGPPAAVSAEPPGFTTEPDATSSEFT